MLMLDFLGACTVVVVVKGGDTAVGLFAATGVGDTVHNGAEGATGEEACLTSAGGDAAGGDGDGLAGTTPGSCNFFADGEGWSIIPAVGA